MIAPILLSLLCLLSSLAITCAVMINRPETESDHENTNLPDVWA